MSVQQTIGLMRTLKFNGGLQAYEDLLNNSALQDLPFNDQLAYIFDGQRRYLENRKLVNLSRAAHPKIGTACMEDIDFSPERGLDKSKTLNRMSCEWITRARNLIITAPTGCGKTYLSCAFGQQAARKGFSWIYKRFPDFLDELQLAHKNGSYPRLRAKLAKMQLLVIDDWAIAPLIDQNRRELLDVVDDRIGTGAMLITSQLPIDGWYDYVSDGSMGGKTLADAIVDRITHNAYRIQLKGESQRKLRAAQVGDAS